MNLFVTDNCPRQAAKWLCDSHCVKMGLEANQIMCAAFHLQNIEAPYKLSHKNHPCTVWARQSRANFEWTLEHAFFIFAEYSERYGRAHKSEKTAEWIYQNQHKLYFPFKDLTNFTQAMPDEFKDIDPVIGYRNYYKFGKTHLHKWRQNKPYWIDE